MDSPAIDHFITRWSTSRAPNWPPVSPALSEQASAVAAAQTNHAAPADEKDLAKYFTRAEKERIAELLETLASLGWARELPMGGMWGCDIIFHVVNCDELARLHVGATFEASRVGYEKLRSKIAG